MLRKWAQRREARLLKIAQEEEAFESLVPEVEHNPGLYDVGQAPLSLSQIVERLIQVISRLRSSHASLYRMVGDGPRPREALDNIEGRIVELGTLVQDLQRLMASEEQTQTHHFT